MWRKSWRSVSLAISPSAPASSTPVGPPPTITKVSQARRFAGSGSRSARFEGQQDAAADAVASSMVLRPGASARPLVVAEVVVGGAGGDDQVVVGTSPSARMTRRCGDVEIRHFAQQHLGIALRLSTARRGDAISPGESPPVATW